MGLKQFKRSDIVLVNLDSTVGSEQGKTRPALVLQNDIGNAYGSTTIVAAMTTDVSSAIYPVCVSVEPSESGLKKTGVVLCNQIRTIDKQRIIKKLGSMQPFAMQRIEQALKVSLGLG